jgi:PST family polysaccharide transporter
VYFWTEVAATVVHVGLAWLLVTQFGLVGSGIAFFGLYGWHSVLIYAVVRRTTGFRWSPANRRLGLLFLPLTLAVFVSFYVFPTWLATGIGLLAVGVTALQSARSLMELLPPESIPHPLRLLVQRRAGRSAAASSRIGSHD